LSHYLRDPALGQTPKLAASSPAVAKTITSTQCTGPRRAGQAEWAQVVWINTGMTDPRKVVTNPSSNWA